MLLNAPPPHHLDFSMPKIGRKTRGSLVRSTQLISDSVCRKMLLSQAQYLTRCNNRPAQASSRAAGEPKRVGGHNPNKIRPILAQSPIVYNVPLTLTFSGTR